MRVNNRLFIVLGLTLIIYLKFGGLFVGSYKLVHLKVNFRVFTEEKAKNHVYKSPLCGCNKTIAFVEPQLDNGVIWCSKESSMRGTHQSIVAYSLFGEAMLNGSISRYFSSLNVIPKQISRSYSGWQIRIYHNFETNQRTERHLLCEMYCQNDNVDLCDYTEILESYKEIEKVDHNDSLSKLNKRIWRFLPLMDPLVDQFIARDIDSEINDREVAAVNQWLNSNYTFHVMRDHQGHCPDAISAGLFGVKTDAKRGLIQQLTKNMISMGNDQIRITDQVLLKKIFWPTVKDDAVIHDSYCCEMSWDSVAISPYPTRRVNLTFVSDRPGANWPRPKKCPEKCRPPKHKDWEYC